MPKADKSIMEGVFAAGDVIKPGRLVDAIGAGTKAAHAADLYVSGLDYSPKLRKNFGASKSIK